MIPFILLCLPILTSAEDCEIDSPIGIWLKNSTNRSCEVVKGHFILDSRANSQAARIYKTFANLRRIEGCIYAKGYTGSTNLSFFSNLEEVVCHKTEAIAAKLENVIHVQEPNLYTMGFDSLRNVTGPGEIFLSFEEEQQSYMYVSNDRERYATEGRECFSKKEMIFLARHPQFIGKMYRACETDDPCFRPELVKELYDLETIPENCTTFVGSICLVGPYPEDYSVLNKFKAMKTIIGMLQVGNNLLSSLEIFSQLEVIYPYQDGSSLRPCYDYDYDLTGTDQPIAVGFNRFMYNIRLPALLPIRPIKINRPIELPTPIDNLAFHTTLFFPDNIADPCEQFPQFTGKCSVGRPQFVEDIDMNRSRAYVKEAWILGTIFVYIGLIFGIRCIIFLFTRQLKNCLPTSQYLIATVILIMLLSGIESVFINQRVYTTIHYGSPDVYVFAVFTSKLLLHPATQMLMKILAAGRQTSLIVLLLCYPDIILSHCWERWNPKFSRLYLCFASIFSSFAFLYFNLSLAIEVRAMRPYYRESELIYMAFVMNIIRHRSFLLALPSQAVIPVTNGFIQYPFSGSSDFNQEYVDSNDMRLEIFGEAFPQVSTICDVVFIISVTIYYLLRTAKVIYSRHNYNIVILLYLQMSMNRVRMFISYDILLARIDSLSQPQYPIHFVWTLGQLLFSSEESKDGLLPQEEDQWWMLMRIVEKLPYISFAICSFLGWRSILYYRRVGLALIYRKTKKNEENSTRLTDRSASDISQRYQHAKL